MAINILHAQLTDEDDILQFCKNAPSHGQMQIFLDRSPRFFSALEVEGDNNHVVIARDQDSNELLGMGTISNKRCYLNTEDSYCGYLGSLRLSPVIQKSFVLFKGYKLLDQLQLNLDSNIFLTTVLEDNTQATKLLSSGRLSLPTYNDYGRLHSLMYGVRKNFWRRDSTVQIRMANADDIDDVISFMKQQSSSNQFIPIYSKEDFISSTGILRDLFINNFLLATDDSGIIGMVSLWNQIDFRRWQVKRYTNPLKLFRSTFNFVGQFLSRPRIPDPNQAVNYFFMANFLIKDHQSNIAESLLHEAVSIIGKQDRNALIMFGVHELNPLLKTFIKYPHFDLKSKLFVVHWEQGAQQFNTLDKKLIPFIELASM